MMVSLSNRQMSLKTETEGKGNLMKPKIWNHRSKDKDVKHLQMKNNASGNFLMSLLLTQINICRKSFKIKT